MFRTEGVMDILGWDILRWIDRLPLSAWFFVAAVLLTLFAIYGTRR